MASWDGAGAVVKHWHLPEISLCLMVIEVKETSYTCAKTCYVLCDRNFMLSCVLNMAWFWSDQCFQNFSYGPNETPESFI